MIRHFDNMPSRHPLLALLLLTAAGQAQDAVREPTYQGRTLHDWLNEAGTLADDPLVMFPTFSSKVLAIRALGPGAKDERQAFDWLASQVAHSPEALAAFGEQALAVLLEHRAQITNRDAFARAVVCTGPRGVLHALREMQGARPWERAPWLEAFQSAPVETSVALAGQLADADVDKAQLVMECLTRMPRVSGELYGPIAALLNDEALAEPATSVLSRLSPSDLAPALTELSRDGDAARRNRLCFVILRADGDWSAVPEVVPLVRRCLSRRDQAAVAAAARICASLGAGARDAAPDLLRVARQRGFDHSTRAAAFAALWVAGPPTDDALTALSEVFADGSDRNRFLIEACVGGLEPLGEAAVPFLRRALSLGSTQLRNRAIHVIGRLGARAASAASDLEALLADPELIGAAGQAILTIAPDRWPALEPRLLEMARAEQARSQGNKPAIGLLIQAGRPAGEVLPFLVEVYRRRDPELRHHDARLTQQLCDGKAFAPLVEALALGLLEVTQTHRHVVDVLCRERDALKPAVPWLEQQFADLEKQVRRSRLPMGCGTRPTYPHGQYARLLGAAGELGFLRTLVDDELPEIQGFGYAGIATMALHDERAAGFLVDRLVKSGEVPPHGDPLLEAIGGAGPQTARLLAKSMFRDDAPALAILGALARMGPAATAAVPDIERCLRETGDAKVAEAARAALRVLAVDDSDDPADLPKVVEALRDARGDLDTATSDRIRRLLPKHAQAILDAADKASPVTRAWLIRAAAGVPQAPLGAAPDVSAFAELRQQMTQRVGAEPPRAGAALAAELFLPHLQDADLRVRYAAFQALQKLPEWEGPDFTARLVDIAVSDPDWRMRSAALTNLRYRSLAQAHAATLELALADDDRYIREGAREVLRIWQARRRH